MGRANVPFHILSSILNPMGIMIVSEHSEWRCDALIWRELDPGSRIPYNIGFFHSLTGSASPTLRGQEPCRALEPCALMKGPTENFTGCLSMFIPYHGHFFSLDLLQGPEKQINLREPPIYHHKPVLPILNFRKNRVLSWPSQQKFPSTEEQDTKYIWQCDIYIYTYVTYGCAWKKSECRSQRSTISTALQAAGYHCPVVTDLGADRRKSQKIKKQMAFEAVNSGDFTHQSMEIPMEIYGNGIMWDRPFVFLKDAICQPGSSWPRLSVSRLQTPWLFAVSLAAELAEASD